MERRTETEACARCGGSNGVKAIEYLRAGQQFAEPWCEPCRRAKLRRSDQAGRVQESDKRMLERLVLVLAMATLGALVMWLLWVIT